MGQTARLLENGAMSINRSHGRAMGCKAGGVYVQAVKST
jgi:hypothetical protein